MVTNRGRFSVPRCFLCTAAIIILNLALFLIPAHADDFTARQIGDYGNVTVMEVSGNFDTHSPDGTLNVLPRQIIAKEFLRTHKDEYDFVAIFTNFDYQRPPNAVAYYSSVKNDVQGIGQEIFDNSSSYGSNGKLQGTIDMWNLLKLATDPLDPKFNFTVDTLVHETLHRWGAFVHFKDWNGAESKAILGYQDDHWSFLFDSGGSTHLGNKWRDNGDGTFTSIAVRKYYSPLDLYLMGMIDKSKVPPTLLIDNPSIDRERLSELGATISGTAHYVTVDDIIAVEGERIPAAKDSQKQFKTAFIYAVTPATFNADDLVALENLRNAYLVRFSILTDGQGLIQVATTPKDDLPANPGVRPPATVPRILPSNIDDGVKWLATHQMSDGSWTDFALTTERDTAEAVTTLQGFPVAQLQFLAGLQWLGSSASVNSDFLARRLEATIKAGGDGSSLRSELLSRRNPDGGWGSGRNFISNPTDTALALKGLLRAGYSDQQTIGSAVAYLQANQHGDGGWSGDDTVSTIQPTAAVLAAFNGCRKSYPLENSISRAIAFLSGKQNPDGGFGNSPSTVYDSAVAIMALQAAGADKETVSRGAAYLNGLQEEDGSWQESPYQTALAVRAVWQATVDPDLAIKSADISFIPEKVTSLPTTAVVSAVIRNEGRSDVAQATVALYDGAVTPEKKVGEQTVALPGLSPVTVTFPVPVTDGSSHYFYVAVDPGNLIKESNENNNSAAGELLPDPTYDFEILAEGLSVSPNPVVMGQNVAITVMVANRGTSDAYSVPVRIFIDDPAAPVEIATLTLDIPAGGSVTKTVGWKASRAGASLPLTVMADPNNAFAETAKSNNRASTSLTVNSGPDLPNLAVSYKDIVITPTPVNQGGNATISFPVKNDGTAPAANVQVSVYDGAPDHGGVLIGSRTIAAVNPGGSVPLSFDWLNIAESGGKIVFIRVDPDNAIQESAKDDNNAFSTLTVLTLPDLAIASGSISFIPAMPKDGDSLTIVVTVQNTGDQDVLDVTISAAEGETTVGSATIPIVKGHSQANAAIQYGTAVQTGSRSLTVIVDPDNKVREQSKANNTAVKAVVVQNASLWLSEPYFSPNGDGVKDTTQFSFRLDSPATVKVVVTDKKGDVVRTFSGGELDNTQGGFVTWDGRADGGVVAPDGAYQVMVVDDGRRVLGSLPVVLDTNRSTLIDAFATRYFQKTNISCGLPPIERWEWLPDESGLFAYIKDGNADYPPGLYVMGPDGGDAVRLTPREWGDDSDPLYHYDGWQDYKLSPDSEKVAFVLKKRNKQWGVESYSNFQNVLVLDLNTGEITVVDANESRYGLPWQYNWYYAYLSLLEDYYEVSGLEWSPDGSKLLYQKSLQTIDYYSPLNEQSTSWLFDPTNGTKLPVLTTPTPVGQYHFAPNGTTFAYYTQSGSALGVVDLRAGTNVTLESYAPVSGGTGGGRDGGRDGGSGGSGEPAAPKVIIDNIAWSDNSLKLAYRSVTTTTLYDYRAYPPRPYDSTEYLIKAADGNGSKRILYTDTLLYDYRYHYLQWAADEKIVLTETFSENSAYLVPRRVYLLNANGSGEVISLKTQSDPWFSSTFLSPDKKKIAFLVSEDGHTARLKVSSVTGQVSEIYTETFSYQRPYWAFGDALTWSPDSSKIAFYVKDAEKNSTKMVITDLDPANTNVIDLPYTYWEWTFPGIIRWTPESNILIGGHFKDDYDGNGGPYYGYFVVNAATKKLFSLLKTDFEFNHSNGFSSFDAFSSLQPSPRFRYLSYFHIAGTGEACNATSNGIDTYFVSSLINTTAELRVAKQNSALLLKGTAQDLNFEGYKLESADVKNPGAWNHIAPPSDTPVANGTFATWMPPGNGSFIVRLTAWDKAGNISERRKRISWGSSSSTITSLYKTTDFISPNGDGVKDTVELRYRILAPVHLEFNIHDEASNLVRTFVRDYVFPADEYISWDGRDEAGRVVPDGKYKIKILDYEFFVEVDATAPKVSAELGRVLFEDKGTHRYYADLSALATDKNIKSWKIEYGDGDNPQKWQEDKAGSDVLVKKDAEGNIIAPAQSTLIERLYDRRISWLKGKKFRITAEDFAGNRSTAITDFIEERIILSKWDNTYTIDFIPENIALPGSHEINGFETLRLPLSSIALQYWNGRNWSDAVNSTDLTPGVLHFDWDPSSLGEGRWYGVRVKLVDSLGGEHFSNYLGRDDQSTDTIFSVDSSCSWQLIGKNILSEKLKLLQQQVMSSEDGNYPSWTDYKIYDALKGDPIPIGEFTIPPPSIKPGLSYQVRMIGTGVSGRMYVSGPAIYPPSPASCPVKIILGITSDKAKECGEVAPAVVSLNAKLANSPSKVTFKTLSYSILKPEGTQLLRSFDIPVDGWQSFTLPTSGLPEGNYTVEAVLSYLDQADNKIKEADASSTVKADRTLPTGRITYPAGNSLKLCPTKKSGPAGDWLGIPIEGVVADNIGINYYELSYGSGDNPSSWQAAMSPALDQGTVINRQISGNKPIQGTIGTWNVAGLSGGTYSLRLKTTDTNGNLSCATSSVSFEDPVGIPVITVDKSLISPNGDGIADDVRLNFQADKYASVDTKVFRLLDNGALDTFPIRVLASGQPYLAGVQSLVWDGKTDAGTPASDGRYGLAAFATDSCGNTTKKWAAVEVDDTPPSVAISYPKPADPLPPGNIIEIKGTATDSHFQNYTLEAGQGDTPSAWVNVANGSLQPNNPIIGVWNTYGLSGKWTLRLSAIDRVGNKSSTTSTIDLGARKTLVKSLDVVPKLFSPNGDNKQDTSRINYEITDACQVVIEIAGAGGATVKSHVVSTSPAGAFSYLWDGRNSAGDIVADGTYQVKLTATLSSNPAFTQTEALTLTVDSTPPTLEFKQPADKSFLNISSLNIVGTASDQNLRSYATSVTGVAGQVFNDSGEQSRSGYLFGAVKDIAEGDYTFAVQATDLGENSTGFSRSFTIDRTPPKAVLDAPKSGGFFGGGNDSVNIIGSLVENNLETFSLRYGSGEAPPTWQKLVEGSTIPAASNLFTWKVGKNDGVPDGLYTISLYGKDKAGLEGEAKVRVTVDNTPPVVAFSSPRDTDYVKGPIDIIGDLKDANLDKGVLELAEGSCAVAAKWSPLRSYTSPVSGGLLASWKILPSDGDYCLRLSGSDKSGNKASTTVSVKIVTHPPASPQLAGKIDGKTNVVLTWARNSETDIAGYNVYRDGQKLNATLITDNSYADSSLKAGTYAYTATAVNQAGTESSRSSAVNLRIDTIGPDALLSFPKSGTRVNELVNVRGIAYSSDDFKEYRIFFGQGQNPAVWSLLRKSPLPISSGTLAEWDTTILPDGAYSLKLEAEDISGNVTLQTISIIVDNTPPSPPVLLSAINDGADVTLTWLANTDADLAGYLLYRNDQLANVAGAVTSSIKPYLLSGTTYRDKTLPDGKHTYYLATADQAGNMSNPSNSLPVTIDIRPPHAVITDPLSNTKFERTIMLNAESVDNDIASLQFRFRKAQDSNWTNLGAPVTNRPFVTYFNPATFGLSFGTIQLQAIATDMGGKVDPSPALINVTYTDLTPPATPADLKAVTNGNGVTLTWSAITEPDLDGYNIYRTSGTSSTKLNSATIKSATFQDANLADGTYGYVITSVDTYGNESKPTGSVLANVYTLLLAQPFTPVRQSVTMTGTNAKAGDTVELFRITAAGQTSVGTANADPQGNFVLGNFPLLPGENRIAARATDSTGNISRASETVIVVYGTQPSSPSGLSAAVQDHSVTLGWNPNPENDLAGYNIYRGDTKINLPVAITTGQVSASSYYYSSYQPSMAFDGSSGTAWLSSPGYGTFSPAWWEIDLPAFEFISSMEIHWLNDASITYSGKDFEVQAWTGYVWLPLATVTGNAANENTFNFNQSYRTNKIRIFITGTNYPYFGKQVGIAEVRILKDSLVTPSSYQAMNLQDGKYSFKVTAVNYLGFESMPSQEAKTDVGDVFPPTAPQGLTATATGSSAALNWLPNGESDLAGYNVYKKTSDGWKLNSGVITGVSFSDPSLLNGSYSYRITAVDMIGNESLPSSEVVVGIAVSLPPPGNPMVATVPEGRALDIAWGPSVGEATYNLYRATTTGGPYQKANTAALSNLSFRDMGLANGTTYYYIVTSVDAVGNESASSGEASGIPADIVAPSKPVILSPAMSETPVRLFRATTDITGVAEPGSSVELYSGGISLAATRTYAADTIERQTVECQGAALSLSPAGDILVYGESGSLSVKDLYTGTTSEISEKGGAPFWSPDGNRIAYSLYDATGKIRISLYDVNSRSSVFLTDDINANEQSPSWSGDNSVIAYVSNKGGNDNVWVKDLANGMSVQAANSLYGSNPRISPDGKKVAFFRSGNIFVTDLPSGTVIQVDAYSDLNGISWSSDSKKLAYISNKNGKPDIYVMDMETQTRQQVTDSSYIKSMPVWSRDNSGIAYRRKEADGSYSLLVAGLGGEVRTVQQDLKDLSFLAWRNSGDLGYLDGKDVYTAFSKGQFNFKRIKLSEGENTFSVSASDDAGNASPSSDKIIIISDSGFLPDIAVTPADIFVYPQFPKPGEDIFVNAVVKNAKETPLDNVDVDIYLWGSTGNLQLLRSETIPHIAADAEVEVGASVNAGSQIGTQNIIVVVDPANKLDELNESNNFASKEFYVTDREEVIVTSTVDSSRYSSNQDAALNVTLRNSGMSKDGVLSVAIEDETGNRVALLDSTPKTLSYGSDNHTYNWNTGAVFAGSYRVHAVFTASDGTVTASSTPFAILPDIRIESGVVTDKQGYGANDNATVTVNLKNNGSNYLVPQLKTRVRIVDSLNATLFSDEKTVQNLFPATESSLPVQWNTGLNLPGDYRAVVETYLDDKLVSNSVARFVINPVSRVSGTVAVDSALVLIGSSLRAAFTVANSGNIGANGSVKAVIVSPESGANIATAEQPVALATNGSQSGEFVFTTTGLELKSYLLSLQYSSQGIQKSIAGASFTVKDGTPPTVTVVSPLAGSSYNATIPITILASDNASGVERVEYQVDGGAWKSLPLADPASGRYVAAWEPTIGDNGSHTVGFRAADRAGNISMAVSVAFDIQMDSIPPVTAIGAGTPRFEAGDKLCVSSATLFTLTAGDDYSGVARTEYRIDDGQWLPYAPFALAEEGERLLHYRSIDGAGNVESEKILKVVVDNTPPRTLLAASDPLMEGVENTVSPDTIFTMTASDGISGVKGIWYRIDSGPWQLFTEGFTLSGLAAGSHTVSVSAADNVGNEESEHAITVRLVLVEVTKEISLDPVVLVGAWEDGANKVKNRSAIDALQQMLSSRKVSFHIAETGDDFKLLFRSGRYNTYLLVDYRDDKVGAELREAVNRGDSLVFIKTRPSVDADMHEVFGVKLTGRTTSDNLPVHLTESPIGGEETLQSGGKPVVIGEILADTVQVFGRVDDKRNLYPALVYNEYGNGKVILYTFDLLGCPEKEKVGDLLGSSLMLLKPEEHTVRALDTLPVRITVSGSEPIGLLVRETIPAGSAADSIVPPAAATEATITWLQDLGVSSVADLGYYLNLPDVLGEYTVATEVKYANHADYRTYATTALTATVQKSSADLLRESIAELNNLPVANSNELAILSDALYRLSRIMSDPADLRDAEKGIDDLLAVSRLIGKLSADVADIRLKLDDLLKIVERKWYLLIDQES